VYYSSVQKTVKNAVLFSLLVSFTIFSTSCGDSGDQSAATAPTDNSTSTEPTNFVAGEVLVKYKLSAFNSSKLSYLSVEASKSNLVLSKQLTSLGVTAIEAVLPKSIAQANDYAANAVSAIDDLNRLRKLILAEDISVQSVIDALALDPDIACAQPNYVYSTGAATNDPLLPQLWGLDNTGQLITKDSGPAAAVNAGCVGYTCSVIPDSESVSGAHIGVVQAWTINTGNANQIIGIIDTGVDYNHPDLAANIWTNPGETAGDGLDNDGNGYIDDIHGYDFANDKGDSMDDNGHGTHIAGTIAGVANNGIGVVGINHRAQIMGLKFLKADGYGSTDDAIKAIEYADSFGVKITNNSWGGGAYDQALYDAIALSNSLFVAAAGNAGWDNDRGNVPSGFTSYPGSFDLPNIITVSATDNEDKLASFSSYGLDTSEVGAPGVAILSTVPTGNCELCNTAVPAYTFLSGTSMAAPHVAGAMGLILSNWPGLSLDKYRTILEQSADAIPALSDKVSSGRIHIYNALQSTYLIQNITPKQNVLAGSNVSYNVQLSSLAGASANLILSLETDNTQISGSLSQSAIVIAANGSATITANISLSAGISQGKYKIKVNASDANSILASAYLLLEVLPDRDLVFTSVDTTATKVDAGDSFVVTTTVRNIGTVDITSSFAVSFFLSPDQNVAAEAEYNIGGFRISRLAAGATYSASTTVKIPVSSTAVLGVPVGNYYIRAVMDAYENVIELNEANNTAFSTSTINVTQEGDLVVTSVTATASSFFTGESSTFNVTIKNQGVTGVVNSCMLVYLSTDAAITTSDPSINFPGLVCQSYLAPGASTTRIVSVKIPGGLSSGSYFIGAVVDPWNKVIETNESNNSAAGSSVQIVRDIDIVISSLGVSSTSVSAGSGLSVTWTLQNSGQSITVPDRWFAGFIYLSTDANITASDTYVGFIVSRDLWAGGIRNWRKFITIPSNTVAGNYYIGVIADPSNVQPETNEANNTASVAVSIQ